MSGFAHQHARQRDLWFALAIATVYLALVAWGMFHHEIWRDEAQSWLLARDSASPLALLYDRRYEGHPVAWYLLIWPFAHLAHSLVAMQVVHAAIGVATAFLIARFAPAPMWVRAVAVFGYFPLYEYGVIARNYGLGVLALIAFCAAYPRRREHAIAIGALLAFAANTSFPAAVLAIAAIAALALDIARSGASRSLTRWAGLFLAGGGVVAGALQMSPPPDGGMLSEWRLRVEPRAAAESLRTIVAAFAPLTRFGPDGWGATYLEHVPGYQALSIVIAAALLAVVVAGLVRRPVALVLFTFGAGGLLAFFYLKSTLSIRHQGFLFVALAMAIWLAEVDRSAVLTRAQRTIRIAFTLLLGVHLVGGATALARDRALVFSGAQETAQLIRSSGVERLPMVVYPDYISSAVLAYLDKDRAFFAHGLRWGSYPLWDRGRLTVSSPWAAALQCALSTDSSVVVLIDPETWEIEPPPEALRASVTPVGCRLGDVNTDESFCVALLDRRTIPMWLERLARGADGDEPTSGGRR